MNRRLILNLLRRGGPLSRAAIASQTGLSAPAVTELVAHLIEEDLAVEGEAKAGSLGRRPIPVGLNYAGRLAIGVKLMVGAIDCVATDLSTTSLASVRLPISDGRPESFAEAIAAVVPVLAERARKPGAPIVGIGVSLPGVIDAARGICRRSYRLDWTDVPLAALIAEHSRVPVWLEDDTNAFAVAQHLFGSGRQHTHVAALAIGAGIGCGLIVDGKLYRGANAAAGKLGHTIHDPTGPVCECGRRGCLMACHSEPAMVRAWRCATGRGPSAGGAEMALAAAAGEAAALAVLREAGDAIGRHLAALVNIVDPEIIVVGGEAVAFGDALFDPMRAALARYALYDAPPLVPDWDDSSWSRGAAALATQHLFDFEQAMPALVRLRGRD